MKRRGILIVISGFSGAGKGTLVKELLKNYDNYALSVSMTTRQPRPGETDGKDYFFVTREAFEEKVSQDGFIEYASYCGNCYGTPRDYVEEQLAAGKDVILEIEIQGALQVKKKNPQTLLLFVTPPSGEELKRRLVNRKTETEEVINQRMARAVEESAGIEQYDYLVINDDLAECTVQTHQLIQAAHATPDRNQDFIRKIRRELGEL
ncbi:MAG: guanylate kinase [Lachnospiraceae bacterium]